MTDIKFVYFDLKARGEPVRLVLAAAGRKYEDVRVSFDDWPAEKPNSPYGQLPYAIYNGRKYGQSIALACFFAREFGLYGKTSLDGLRVDEVVGLFQDLANAIFSAKFEADEAKKATMLEKLWGETVPAHFGFWRRLLNENMDRGFFVGSTVSLADLLIYSICDSLIAEKATIKSEFPSEVQKVRKNVEAHPFLKTYLAKRPSTPF